MTETDEVIRRIQRDFTNNQGPFDGLTFPEEELVEDARPYNDLEKTTLLTAFCMLDYNRDARRLKNNLVDLYAESAMFADPNLVNHYTVEEVKEVFREIKFRYKNRDAEGLYHNYEIIDDKYGTVQGLLEDVDYDAVKLVERLEEDNFRYLKGDKLSPFYARVLHDEVHKLSRIWEVDIPVDTHIRTLTHHLTNDNSMTDDEIRGFWRQKSDALDISPHLVDGGLWHIGNQWDEWGEDYFNEVAA